MSAGIFISYRRQDSIAHARAVYERLRAEFGLDAVFMDLEGLDIGEDFVESLERQLARCQVMLVLIGPQWLNALDSRGRRRLDQANDFVRLELGTALARPGVRVVPVLIDGTELPTEDALPAELHPLLRRQALSLRFANFDADARHLASRLRRLPALQPTAPVSPVAPRAGAELSMPLPPLPDDLPPATQPTPVALPTLSGDWRPAWASEVGDDRFGRWAEFSVSGVVQRLRWLPPGEFLMGSPDHEPERYADEGPQHRVRLSQGFWLADTACTQGLWRAVMAGDNPAHFHDDPANPVEHVSHHDVQRFLARLQGLLGQGAEPVLPTEAQWEYACRAGTTTAFSIGAQVSTDLVNYDGHLPYNGAAMGLHRECTVPVKSLPPNPWGLYEVHGNVWEWCADGGLRAYPGASSAPDGQWGSDPPDGPVVEDPFQQPDPAPEAHRVLRGGSWLSGAGYARSAMRNALRGDVRYDCFGFRLAISFAG